MTDIECKNTDRELWRGPDEGNGDYYADRIHMTKEDALGIDCGGSVYVRTVRKWHSMPSRIDELEDAAHVPGMWKCTKCGFVLTESLLSASHGTVTADTRPGGKCPNDDTLMRKFTWKERALEAEGRLESMWEERRKRRML